MDISNKQTYKEMAIRIRALIKSGLTVEQVSQAMNIPESTVRRMVIYRIK